MGFYVNHALKLNVQGYIRNLWDGENLPHVWMTNHWLQEAWHALSNTDKTTKVFGQERAFRTL